MKVKINKKYSVPLTAIDYVLQKPWGSVWVYLKEGFPRILIADCGYVNMLMRIANVKKGI